MARKKFLSKAPPVLPEDTPVAPTPASAGGDETCPLCGRPLAGPMNRHHLIPVSKGGRHTPTLLLHKACHDKIHSVIPEKELKRYYHTVVRLQAQEEIAAFIQWVQNKEPEYYDKSKRKKN